MLLCRQTEDHEPTQARLQRISTYGFDQAPRNEFLTTPFPLGTHSQGNNCPVRALWRIINGRPRSRRR